MDLQTFFQTYSSVSIAFSGGCDSAFLLHQAKKYAHRAEAFYVKSDFQPAFELEDAKRLCQELAVTLHILPVAVLSNPNVCNNNENRC
ncbi:MAG: 7-cyano-7-deazaguanine synthase, partial [Lachnospiraceae bacterium]